VTDPFELVKTEEMLIGYSAAWHDEPYKAVAVEEEFYFTPEVLDTDPKSPTVFGTIPAWFDVGGKMDVVAQDLRSGEEVIVEHKSTIHDITIGSPYWAQTLMNTQLSTYMRGARALGYRPSRILFDVLARQQQRPCEATPVELRKYTKPTKAEPVSRLYANQRENDETPAEFRLRVRESILAAPDDYYKRQDVVRLAREEYEAELDLWYTTEAMRLARETQRFPRNPDACVQIGRVCGFLAVCAGHGTLDDPSKFRRSTNKHEELEHAGKRQLPVLTNSEISTFRKCQRLHHLRYDEGWRSAKTTEPMRMGTLIHRGLEGWWIGNMHGDTEVQCVERGIVMMRDEKKTNAVPEDRVD
jgi:hypothetical protein